MGRYTDQPTLDVDFIKPRRMSFDTKGGGMDGGRNGLGESVSIEMTGGGIVVGSYEECLVFEREEHEYINWLAARLNGSHRFVNVPILSDWMGPFPSDTRGIPKPIVSGVPHSDGALFSDGAGYSQATVYGTIASAGALNAGVISIRLFGAARSLRWSDWFSIYHPTKGWRAYRYWEVQSVTQETNPVYTLAITPPLREAAPLGQRVEFARPRFVGKFPSGFTLRWDAEAFWQSRPTLQFSEAF